MIGLRTLRRMDEYYLGDEETLLTCSPKWTEQEIDDRSGLVAWMNMLIAQESIRGRKMVRLRKTCCNALGISSQRMERLLIYFKEEREEIVQRAGSK